MTKTAYPLLNPQQESCFKSILAVTDRKGLSGLRQAPSLGRRASVLRGWGSRLTLVLYAFWPIGNDHLLRRLVPRGISAVGNTRRGYRLHADQLGTDARAGRQCQDHGQYPGRKPYTLETMLRTHLLQNWFSLGNPAKEEALYETTPMRQFARLTLSASIPEDHDHEFPALAGSTLRPIRKMLAGPYREHLDRYREDRSERVTASASRIPDYVAQ